MCCNIHASPTLKSLSSNIHEGVWLKLRDTKSHSNFSKVSSALWRIFFCLFLHFLFWTVEKIWSVHALRNINMPTQSRCCFVISKQILLFFYCFLLPASIFICCFWVAVNITAPQWDDSSQPPEGWFTDSLYPPAKPLSLCLICLSVNITQTRPLTHLRTR